MRGEGIGFGSFSAKAMHQVARCKDGKVLPPTALPTLPAPTLNPRRWISPKPSEAERACLMDQRFGCYVIQDMRTCLGSRDGRPMREWRGLKIRGEPCVWCGGGPCHTSSSNLCEPYDFLMRGEGIGFSFFNAKTTHQVARCKDGKALPPTASPTLPPLTTLAMSHAVLMWGQCGGIGWVGNTTCQEGSICVVLHSYFSQCQPELLARTAQVAGAKLAAGAQPANASAVTQMGPPVAALGAGPAPEPVVLHRGEDCWYACGERGGSCGWCGEGAACCRKNWPQDPPECKNVTDYLTATHECVVPAPVMATHNPEEAAPTLAPGTDVVANASGAVAAFQAAAMATNAWPPVAVAPGSARPMKVESAAVVAAQQFCLPALQWLLAVFLTCWAALRAYHAAFSCCARRAHGPTGGLAALGAGVGEGSASEPLAPSALSADEEP